MNCLEAQSYIMPFIEGKVPGNKQEEFVMHMKTCKTCHEELEIYYTLIVGMEQLDENKELSTDFDRDLENELGRMNNKVKGRRRRRFSSFSMVFSIVVFFLALYYGQVLSKVYAFEQKTKLNQQGRFYFESNLSEKLVLDYEDRAKKEEVIDYSTLKYYKRVRMISGIRESVETVIRIGGELIDE